MVSMFLTALAWLFVICLALWLIVLVFSPFYALSLFWPTDRNKTQVDTNAADDNDT